MSGITFTRCDIEDFLFAEAALLDRGAYDDWHALFLPEGTMEVPTTDWTGWDAQGGGFFMLDSPDILAARVKRLKNRKAHAENPRSRVHRLIGNVRLLSQDGDEIEIEASFVIHRFRDLTTQSYAGYYQHRLKRVDGQFRFVRRRSVLAHEQLEAGQRLSFIL